MTYIWNLDIPYQESSSYYDWTTKTYIKEECKNSYGKYPDIYFHIDDRKPTEGKIVYVYTLEVIKGSRHLNDSGTACWKNGKWIFSNMETKVWGETGEPWFTHWHFSPER